MSATFAKSLKKLRVARGISQRELADALFVDRSTVARWEGGTRVPDATLLPRIAECLGVDVGSLLEAMAVGSEPNVIVVDDERLVLRGTIPVLKGALPGTNVTGFERASDALAYAHANPIALAFLDVEMGHTSGLDLCRRLLEVRPRTNVVFLTAYREYSFDAWDTGACGFLLKPITPDEVRGQLSRLRFPMPGLSVDQTVA